MIKVEPLPFIATVEGVEEFILVGQAKLDFWQKWLEPLKLYPLERNGLAELGLSITRLSWNGIPFRECVISIAIASDPSCKTFLGYYLIQAFNSSRILSWMERRYFQTPYFRGNIELNLENRTAQLGSKATPDLKLIAAPMTFAPNIQPEDYQGPIFLPNLPGHTHRLFYVRLSGQTSRWPCQPGDSIMLSSNSPVFDCLLASDFRGREWGLREHAWHARSRTIDAL